MEHFIQKDPFVKRILKTEDSQYRGFSIKIASSCQKRSQTGSGLKSMVCLRYGCLPVINHTRYEKIEPRNRLFFEKLVQLTFRVRGYRCRPTAAGRGIEFKVIAEITPILFHNPLRLRFATVVIRPGVIKSAVETDVQIAPAERADIPSPHGCLSVQFFPALVTHSH